jgi:predicted pyridoxine 5'-phosphate oxidase superfamily flavin-nucleotide-binding protein
MTDHADRQASSFLPLAVFAVLATSPGLRG